MATRRGIERLCLGAAMDQHLAATESSVARLLARDAGKGRKKARRG
ncbi:MAG: hypothetical protein ACHQAQ_16345 [Hyphomicrobiales bacterium]